MKNHFKIHILSFLILFLFSTSCSLTDSVCKDGQGDIINQEREISAFTALEARGSFRVILFQDSSIKEQSITISAQENIIDLIQTRIAGQSLIIDSDECYNTSEEVMITIRTPALSQIVLAGSGDIILQDTVRKNNIEFVLDGSGNIKTTPSFPIIASVCVARLKGSGTMELDFDATSIVKASIDGSGIMALRGETTENSLNINGSGNIKAFSLPVLTSTAEIIGSGNIELTATDLENVPSRATLNARISGSGTILLKGNATLQSEVSGSGKVERVD